MRIRPLLPILLACAVLPVPLRSAPQTPAPASSRPTLVVMLVVDQMRGDYIEKYGHQWKGGLRRLIDRGAWFQNAVYPYAYTVTCAGHATISTGAFPRTHGITGNSWWDRATGKTVACADDPAQQAISYGDPVKGAWGPSRLMIPTFTDELRAQAAVPPRIVTMSMKERTAIMLAGHGATAVAWYEAAVGTLVTSSAYATARVPFIERFVKAHPIESDLQASWTPRRPPGFYAFADSGDGERPPSFWTRTFPHPLRQAAMKPGQGFVAWEESPFSDAYLERLGEAAIDTLGLGKGPGTDYLGISFSALDLVGHDFGPWSHEVQDVLLRLDEDLDSLFAMLDRRLGRSGYLVALTADHGVSPIPEQMIAQGFAAGRIAAPTIARVQEVLAAASGGTRPAGRSGGQIYLTPEARSAFARDARARETVIANLEQIPGIARVLFTDERGRWPNTDVIARAVRNSYFPDRAGDVYVVQQPYWLSGDSSAATHGTPYRYDTWVPLFLYGKGIKAGRYAQAVSPADVAPTLAWLCGITLGDADGRPLVEATAPQPPTRRGTGQRPSSR